MNAVSVRGPESGRAVARHRPWRPECAADDRGIGQGQRRRLTEGKSARRPVSRVLSRAAAAHDMAVARHHSRAFGPCDGHSSGTPVTGRLARPTRGSVRKSTCPAFAGRVLLSGLAPGGVCRAASVAGRAVRSYRTVSPLPFSKERRFAFCGTVPRLDARRTLSGTVFPWSPDFPPSPHRWGKSGHPTIWLGHEVGFRGCRVKLG